MTIHKPRPSGDFTQLPNAIWNDSRLNARAVFYLGYLLSKPSDWHSRAEQLRKLEGHECSLKTAERALEKLRIAGYIKYERGRDPQTGQVYTRVHVYGTSQPLDKNYVAVEERNEVVEDYPF